MYYDKQGKQLELMEWANLYEQDREYGRVGSTMVDDVHVSTIWIGLDHNLGGIGDPLIFETMTFDEDGDSDFQQRYSTLEQAQAGHANTVKALENGRSPYDEPSS